MTNELSPAVVTDQRIIRRETLRGGQAWSRRMKRHEVLRIVDVAGSACASALLYNEKDPLERYNMPDTLKAQFTAFLTRGRVLYSDMGRVLCSIIGDTCGWHDTISGAGDAVSSVARFGEGGYQERRNDFHRNARDNFMVELAKHGLGKRDVVANVNFFVRVVTDDGGNLAWRGSNSRPGAWVDLRFEMGTLIVLTNTPHPLDPATRYAPPSLDLVVWQGAPPASNDECRNSRPENGRGFALTEAYVEEQSDAPSLGPRRRVS